MIVETQPVSEKCAVDFDLKQLKSILLVKLDALGDFVLMTPFLRGLRNSAPNAQITLLVRQSVYPLAELCPYVNRVLVVDVSDTHCSFSGVNEEITKGFFEDFKKGSFDLALVPRWDYDHYYASVVAKQSQAPHVIGFSRPEQLQTLPPYEYMFTQCVERPFCAHEITHNLALLEYIGGEPVGENPEVWISKQDLIRAREIIGKIPGKGPLVAICPSASIETKMLRGFKLLSILRQLKQALPKLRFLILGAGNGQDIADLLKKDLADCHSIFGQTSIRQTAAVIASCAGAVTMDSAPGHVAAAAGVPLVVFSPHPATGDPIAVCSPERWIPKGPAKTIMLEPPTAMAPCKDACGFPDHHCIMNIPDQSAVEAIIEVLGTRART